MSSDGKLLAAVVYGGHVYTSIDYGETWKDKSIGNASGNLDWVSIAMSSDGKLLAAVVAGGPLSASAGLMYTSVDFGDIWQSKKPSSNTDSTQLKAIAVSSDGNYRTVVTRNVYVSSDSGSTWDNKSSGSISGQLSWNAVAMSSNGQYQLVAGGATDVFLSKNFGFSWDLSGPPTPSGTYRDWTSVSISSNGGFLAVAERGGHVYASNDFGVNWQDITSGAAAGSLAWQSLAISDDGRLLTGVVNNGLVYTYALP